MVFFIFKFQIISYLMMEDRDYQFSTKRSKEELKLDNESLWDFLESMMGTYTLYTEELNRLRRVFNYMDL